MVEGFKAGFRGLVNKAVSEGRNDGAMGAIRGFGEGIADAIVRPVVGMADGLSALAQGISNELVGYTAWTQLRPARAFSRAGADLSQVVLVPLNVTEAAVQDFVLKEAKREGESDDALLSVTFTFTSDHDKLSGDRKSSDHFQSSDLGPVTRCPNLLVLTEKFVYLLEMKLCGDSVEEWQPSDALGVIWRHRYGDISHCSVDPQSSVVRLFLYRQVVGPCVCCASPDVAIQAYAALWRLAHRMGTPASMISPDMLLVLAHSYESAAAAGGGIADQGDSSSMDPTGVSGTGLTAVGDTAPRSDETTARRSVLQGSNDTPGSIMAPLTPYRFGAANSITVPPVKLAEEEILRKAAWMFVQASLVIEFLLRGWREISSSRFALFLPFFNSSAKPVQRS